MLIHSCGAAQRGTARLIGQGWLATFPIARNCRRGAVILDSRPRRNRKKTSAYIVVAISRKKLLFVTRYGVVVNLRTPPKAATPSVYHPEAVLSVAQETGRPLTRTMSTCCELRPARKPMRSMAFTFLAP